MKKQNKALFSKLSLQDRTDAFLEAIPHGVVYRGWSSQEVGLIDSHSRRWEDLSLIMHLLSAALSRPCLHLACMLAFSLTSISVAQDAERSTAAHSQNPEPLAGLKPVHPRLLVAESDWETLRETRPTDAELAAVVRRIETDAAWLLDQPPLAYEKKGKRLLDVSRQALQRILFWSVTYHLTGNSRYAERAERELVNLAGFPDWNPSHFLDAAEMTAAMAFGYDWLYAELAPESRAVIRRAIVEKGIEPGLWAARSRGSWHRAENNWNQVCFGGLTLGALAIADEEPEPATRLLTAAREGIQAGLRPYAPDGIYPEGPTYWGYGTVYQVMMLAALQSALGTQWGLEESPGFLQSGAVQMQLTGPSEKFYNFFDSGENKDLQPAMFWFARRLENPSLLSFQQRLLREALGRSVEFEPAYHENRLFPLLALWWSPMPAAHTIPNLPLIWHGDGPNPAGVFRTSWSDTNALYLAFKGGAADLSHGHMDAGSFILEADGVRWGIELGRQDYLSLESKGINLWSYAQDSQRWSVFRLNNFSHNTLTLDHQLHRVNGNARIIEFVETPQPKATLDLSPAFAGQAERVVRQFELGPDRTVHIRDELSGLAPGTNVRWAMVTRANVTTDGAQATLTQEGKTLRAQLLAPEQTAFSVVPADPPDDGFNAPNPDTRVLTVNLSAPEDGHVRLHIVLRTVRQAP